jgi:ferredoxin-NADP reductase
MSFTSAEVKAVTQSTPEVKQFQFELEDGWDFEPGQHTVMRFEKDGEEVERPYNMINVPGEDKISLAIKKYPDGEATPWIHDLEPGDEVEFGEPRGNLELRDLDKDIVLISTGTGATPMFNLLREYLQDGSGKVYYFHGEKTTETILFKEELELLESEHDNLEVIFSLSDEEWHGREGFIQNHINKYLDEMEDKHYYICGVPAMVVQTGQLLKGGGVKDENIITEGWEDDAVSDAV